MAGERKICLTSTRKSRIGSRHTAPMTRAATRIDCRLIAAIERLDRPTHSIAETNRRVGAVAEALGLPRPSYEQVRTLAHALRNRRKDPGVGSILLDIALRQRSPRALEDLGLMLSGDPSK